MTSLIRRSALVICILAFAAQASAEVVLLSQSRSVYSAAETWGFEGYSDSLSAPDFGLFEENIIAVATAPWDGFAQSSATQASEIQTGHFSIHGSASAYAA